MLVLPLFAHVYLYGVVPLSSDQSTDTRVVVTAGPGLHLHLFTEMASNITACFTLRLIIQFHEQEIGPVFMGFTWRGLLVDLHSYKVSSPVT